MEINNDLNLKQVYDNALSVVNKCRVALGDSFISAMPKGLISDPVNCPIAKAIGHNILVGSLHLCFEVNSKWRENIKKIAKILNQPIYTKFFLNGEWQYIYYPPELGQFIDLFDTGCYPDLILNDSV